MTIYIDASAIVAMIGREPEATTFADRLEPEAERLTSAVAIWEAARAVCRVRAVDFEEARTLVADFVRDATIAIVTIGAEEAHLSLDAHQRYGKGVHIANLNMGDCFAYACAKRYDAAILFKGRDFIHTDLIDATLA